MFDSLTQRFSTSLASLRSRGKISANDIDNTCQEIRTALLEADVALLVVNQFIEEVRTRSLEILPTSIRYQPGTGDLRHHQRRAG